MELGWGLYGMFLMKRIQTLGTCSLLHLLVPFISYLVLLVSLFSPLLSTHSSLPASFRPWSLVRFWHILADAGVLVFGLRLLLSPSTACLQCVPWTLSVTRRCFNTLYNAYCMLYVTCDGTRVLDCTFASLLNGIC
jgi:hypothetical protein